ncbi:hypothetical protein HUN08_11020 [Gordonia sp. X0973]|uniref:hypothetical protein n=1 Tax=Gordonia sp. X0973 TaxID=2742602 RepID=UPI000F51CF22|nr:hypothetical protein [Gordonia sp. X0973]QKT07662.1 hypothetical protein HUN08_11020 [Gordonia sp. X0973]
MSRLRRPLAGILASASAVSVMACSVGGEASPAGSPAVSSFTSRYRSTSACRESLGGMRSTVEAYNAMIAALNSTQSMGALRGTDAAVVARLDEDVRVLRAAGANELPPPLATEMARTADAAEAVRRAIAEKNAAVLNPAARRWDAARQALVRVCADYLHD